MKALIIIEAQGKIHAWTRIAKAAGMMPTVLATLGHMSRYPKTLFPIGIDIAGTGLVDPARRADPEVLRSIVAAVKAHPAEAPIYVATDDDVEGDLIALDVIDAILMAMPNRIDSLMRLRPGAITPEALHQAIAAARPLREDYDIAVDCSIHGRARAGEPKPSSGWQLQDRALPRSRSWSSPPQAATSMMAPNAASPNELGTGSP